MTEIRRVGVPPDIYCLPFNKELRGNTSFKVVIEVPTQNSIRMRKRELDAAFLSPIDYARESSDYCIVPDISVSSRQPTNTIAIHFKESLHTINTLAVQPTSTSEIVLASILLSERFDVRPTIIPVMGSLDQMLRSADAALLTGNAALELRHQNRIDLVDEWNDLTGLPYVHGFWCVRETEVTKDDILMIQKACERGMELLGEIAQTEAAKLPFQFSADALKEYLESFSFVFADEEQHAVMEFLRYAYYHGILPDVADLNFYPLDKENTSPFIDPSQN